VEYEGTYPLPEAQLDRFLLMVTMGYPDEESERELLEAGRRPDQGHDLDGLGVTRITAEGELNAVRGELDAIVVAPETTSYLLDIVRHTRESPDVSLGASPRAALAWLAAAKAMAALRGSPHVTPDDVKDKVRPVLRHRLVPQPEAEMAGADPDGVIEGVLSLAKVPR